MVKYIDETSIIIEGSICVSVESHNEILEAIFAREEIDHNESIELHSDSNCWEEDSDDD